MNTAKKRAAVAAFEQTKEQYLLSAFQDVAASKSLMLVRKQHQAGAACWLLANNHR